MTTDELDLRAKAECLRRNPSWDNILPGLYGRLFAAIWEKEHPADSDAEPTPERLLAAGFVETMGGTEFLYRKGSLRLTATIAYGGDLVWEMCDPDNEIIIGLLPDMAAVHAWMRAVDAANGAAPGKGVQP